jgi:sigma-54 dependent transcriptional regulator, acetoin dehydrogenase operon transcriptional activator AcoR
VLDLPQSLQGKLLRALELREVQPLGESRAHAVNFRVVAAAQEDLSAAVARGEFRADLHARLNGFTVELPPLRERVAEIPALFEHLLKGRSGGSAPMLDARLIERLCLHGWPGNVRELDMLGRRLLGLHGHEPRLTFEHLASVFSSAAELPTVKRPVIELSALELDQASRTERDVLSLLEHLRKTNGNLARAASLSRISRQRAYRLLQSQTGLDLASFREQV